MAKKATIAEFLTQMINRYPSNEDFKKDLDRIILDLEEDKVNQHQVKFYKRIRNKYNKLYGQ